MSLKKTLIIIGSITVVLVIILSFLLSKSFEEPVSDVGITRPDVEIKYQEPEEEDQRTKIPAEVEENLEIQIEGYLSAGKFEELDAFLKSHTERFKDSPITGKSITQIIDSYRADLTYIRLSQKNDLPMDSWSFENPDVLAAAYSYLPISKKYFAPYSQTSAIFPASRNDIQLTERSLTKAETYQLLQTISYDGDFEVHTIKLFDVKINGEDVELVTFIDPATRLWVLYEARVGWEGALTCEEVDSMIEEYGVENIDAIVFM